MGCLGVQCPPAVCPLCYLPLNHSTEFNEIRCVSYSHEWGCYGKLLLTPAPWGPRERSKGQNHLISITMSISKIFIPNFVCVLTNERYKPYQTGFLFCCMGHAPGVGLLGAMGAQVVIFFQTRSCGKSNRQG